MKRTTRRSTGKSLFAVAKLMNTAAQNMAGYVGAQHRAELDELKAENIRLRNVNTALQQGYQSNRVVEGDLKIELLKLKIEKEKRALGITDSPYVASDYPEPGNIREEERKS